MTATAVIYYSTVFIFSLFLINRMYETKPVFIGERDDIRRTFSYLCVCFIVWSFITVFVGIVDIAVLDRVFLLIAEFTKAATFVLSTELCASITDRALSKKGSSYTVTSELMYFGTIILFLRIMIMKGNIDKSYFGRNFSMNRVCIVLNLFYYICIFFFFGAYTYMHYYSCKTKRELYISKRCMLIGSILAGSLVIESVGYVMFNIYVPSMYFGMVICYFLFRDLLIYKRSIEYNESDYSHILSSAHHKPAFVCDDDGRILFENTRAFVMKQTYKDNYKDRLLTDIFEITDYDKERLKDKRITQTFDVYCRYPREPREMLLNVKHNLDKFGAIISTEVEVGYANVPDDELVVAANTNNSKNEKAGINLSLEELRKLRTEALIQQLKTQKKLYSDNQKELFSFNLKGISKAAEKVGLTALEELCDRIQTELSYGEWETLESMMVDIDRQYETLEVLN